MKVRHFILLFVIVIVSMVMTSCTGSYYSTRPHHSHGSTLIIRNDNGRSHDNGHSYRYKNEKKDKRSRDRH